MIILKHVADLLTHCKLALTEFEMTDADTADGFLFEGEGRLTNRCIEILWK